MRISSIEVNQILLQKPNVTFSVVQLEDWVKQENNLENKSFVISKNGEYYKGTVTRKYIENKEGNGKFVYSHETDKFLELYEVKPIVVRDKERKRIIEYRRK